MPLTEPLQQVDRTYVRWRGRRLSYFGGCDYFRLSSHPAVARALVHGFEKFGLNVAASRMTTGNHLLFGELENAIASFFGSESALLAASGYVANIIAAQALAGELTHALIDERSHPSLLDAATFLNCEMLTFARGDATHISRLLKTLGARAKIILLTDGMFSHDGSVAPLREYLLVLPRRAWLLVDDAHGGGVIGRTGRGTLEHEGISRERVVQTVSLSKAFGVYGGAILCSARLRERMIARSRLFNGNTPLPLPLAKAARKSIELLRTDGRLRGRLVANALFVKQRLRDCGLAVPEHPGPIVQIVPSGKAESSALERRLLKRGIFPSLIHYPGGPPEGYFRFMISSEHTRGQLDALVDALGHNAP